MLCKARVCSLFDLRKGSNVVPFWVCYGFWVRDYNIVPKKELHWSPWVGVLWFLGLWCLGFMGFRCLGLGGFRQLWVWGT